MGVKTTPDIVISIVSFKTDENHYLTGTEKMPANSLLHTRKEPNLPERIPMLKMVLLGEHCGAGNTENQGCNSFLTGLARTRQKIVDQLKML